MGQSGTLLPESAIRELRTSLGGELVSAGDPSYEMVRKIWNGAVDRRQGLIATAPALPTSLPRCDSRAHTTSSSPYAAAVIISTAVSSRHCPLPSSSSAMGLSAGFPRRQPHRSAVAEAYTSVLIDQIDLSRNAIDDMAKTRRAPAFAPHMNLIPEVTATSRGCAYRGCGHRGGHERIST